jgi:hypothetical protein
VVKFEDKTGGLDMAEVTVSEIDKRLQLLPPEKLNVVYEFVSFLLERDGAELLLDSEVSSRATMLASEEVLSRDWNLAEVDAAWAHL